MQRRPPARRAVGEERQWQGIEVEVEHVELRETGADVVQRREVRRNIGLSG